MTMGAATSAAPALRDGAAWAREWLLTHAFARWSDAGYDHIHGGFYDKLTFEGMPTDLPKRARVQARQIFVYAEAGRIGWDGPWQDLVRHALDFLFRAYRRPDGLFRASVSREGEPVAEAADLYDQAFVLFALAAVAGLPELPISPREEALALLATLDARFAHPLGGFRETDGSAGLRSNPHMHMLEALLAWCEIERGTAFERSARDILTLARTRFLDPQTGAVGEYYDDRWVFTPDDKGALREPGHQFEWAYLFDFAGALLGEDVRHEAERLHGFGELFGISDGRPVFALDAGGSVIDGATRLWAITERLRTSVIRDARNAEDAIVQSLSWLHRFIDAAPPGLWRERVDRNGRWIDEPVPASSLYHLLTGLMPILELAR